MVASGAGAGIGSAIGGLAAFAMDGGIPDEYDEIIKLYRDLEVPDFDMRSLTPAQLRVVGDVSPEVYSAIIRGEAATPQDSPEVRAEQMGALRHLADVRREGLPLSERLAAEDMQRAIAGEFRRNNQSVMRNLAERGRLGGSAERQARLQANQSSGELARGAGSDLARMAVGNRLNAAYGAGELGGRIRSQDIALSDAKAGHINRFNAMASQLLTQAARDAAGSRERANYYNVGNRQRVADTNEQSRYSTERDNLNRQNALRDQRFANETQRIGGLAGALSMMANAQMAKDAQRYHNFQQIGGGIGGAAGSSFDFGGFGG